MLQIASKRPSIYNRKRLGQASTVSQKMLYVSTYALGNLGVRHVQGEIRTRENVQKAKTRETSILLLIK